MIVIGLRQNKRCGPTHTNSKLHDRTEIEQNSENKSHYSICGNPKIIIEPYPNLKKTIRASKSPKDFRIKSELKEL